MLQQFLSLILCVALVFTGPLPRAATSCAKDPAQSCCCAISEDAGSTRCECSEGLPAQPKTPSPASPRHLDLALVNELNPGAVFAAVEPEAFAHAETLAAAPGARRSLQVLLSTFRI